MHYAKMAAAGYKGGLITAPDVGDFCCAGTAAIVAAGIFTGIDAALASNIVAINKAVAIVVDAVAAISG